MKTVDFSGKVTANGQIAVPPEIAALVPPNEPVEVVLQWGMAADDASWREAGRQRFEAAYSEDDSVYESLIHDAPAR
jgi:hypothetical protein